MRHQLCHIRCLYNPHNNNYKKIINIEYYIIWQAISNKWHFNPPLINIIIQHMNKTDVTKLRFNFIILIFTQLYTAWGRPDTSETCSWMWILINNRCVKAVMAKRHRVTLQKTKSPSVNQECSRVLCQINTASGNAHAHLHQYYRRKVLLNNIPEPSSYFTKTQWVCYKNNRSMTFREIITVYCENHNHPLNSCPQKNHTHKHNLEAICKVLNVKSGCTQTWILYLLDYASL